MAVTQKMSEIGWFYHAPAKPKVKAEPAVLPPHSQIPGLSDIAIDPNEQLYVPKRNVIKDYDSKYTRLAKGGGRQDLLRFKDFKPKTNDATGYPRNEWFYLEDNRLDDEEQKQNDQWDFKLPEYMVHEPFKPEDQANDEAQQRGRYPYAREKQSVFQTEGNKVTDKTVKIPNKRQYGFGYRQEKQRGKPVKQNAQPREIPIKPTGELESKPRYLAMPQMESQTGKPKMGKILSYNYQSEWHDDMKKWQQKNSHETQKPTRTEPLTTEYHDNINKMAQGLRAKPKQNRRVEINTKPTEKSTSLTTQDQQQKELFKLSRFSKVHSKVDSHRIDNSTMPMVQ